MFARANLRALARRERGALARVERAVSSARATGGRRAGADGDGVRVNEAIESPTVRLILDKATATTDAMGANGGVEGASTSTHAVMSAREALRMARAMGLDLVEVNGTQTPPVCRMTDYERARYEQRRKMKEQKKASTKAQKRDVIKELRLTAKIDAHDLRTKMSGAKKFLEAGNRVTFRIMFKKSDGIALDKRATRGAEIMENVMSMLEDVEVVSAPKMVGLQHMTASVSPKRKK